MTTYLPRIADGELARRLSYAGAVVVEGPRACGKTSTAASAGLLAAFALLRLRRRYGRATRRCR